MNARRDPSSPGLKALGWALVVIGPLGGLGSACLASTVDGYATGGSGGAGHGSESAGPGGGGNSGGSGAHHPTGSGGGCSGVLCGNTCAELDSDPKHCGSCSNACPGSFGCTKGVCNNEPVSVLAGGLISCVILTGGDLYCMGRDVWGEVGVPSNEATFISPHDSEHSVIKPTKIDVPPIAEVGSGSEFTCARTRAGEVYCWGSNISGRLGHDPASDPDCTKAWVAPSGYMGPNVAKCSGPTKVALPAGVKAEQMAVGVGATCIRTHGGDVYCWGDNSDGAIQAPTGGNVFSPTKNANVDGDATDIAVSASAEGWDTVCVVRKGTKNVDCWGESANTFFTKTGGTNCFHSTMDQTCDPVAHPVPTNFATGTGHFNADHLQIGYLTGCGILGGTVSCWGGNEFGQFGDGTWARGKFNPIQVAGLPTTIKQFSATFATTLALDANGDVYGVGWNALAQVGDGTALGSACRPSPITSVCVETVKKLTTLTKIAQVNAGSQSSGAVGVDHVVYLWGTNIDGEQGHAPNTMNDVPCGDGSYCNYVPQPVKGLP